MQPSIRHMRMFVTLVQSHSVTRTARQCNVSQPAVTQAMNKMEQSAGQELFSRQSQGMVPTPAGTVLAQRTERALSYLDAAMADMSRVLRQQATRPQLAALVAVTETGNFTLAARRLGLAQPTVHRSITMLEQVAGVQLFERTSHGLIATRAAQRLAQAARLAFAELRQAESDLAALSGRKIGRIVVGVLRMSRFSLLPRTTLRFRAQNPDTPVEVVEGHYDDLLRELGRGDLDMVVGVLDEGQYDEDTVQAHLMDDTLAIVAHPDHPLAEKEQITRDDLLKHPWVISQKRSSLRSALEALLGEEVLEGAIVSPSMVLLTEVLGDSQHLGVMPRAMALGERDMGNMVILPFEASGATWRVGMTTRIGWEPTVVQRQFMDILQEEAETLSRVQ